MEHASLTLAHSYARKASEETQKSRLAIACSEHERAAESFRSTAEDVEDVEAIRVLKLLEDHHRKLAEVIKAQTQATKRLAEKSQQTTDVGSQGEGASKDAEKGQKEVLPAIEKAQIPSHFRADPRRDSSPALAKDMASRRGIPQIQQKRTLGTMPSLSNVQATGRMSAVSGQRPAHDARSTRQAGAPVTAIQARESETDTTSMADEQGFSRFYSNITSGPLSKLSSMLAFAGLPLTEDEESPTQSKVEKTSARANTGPDVNQIFSRAALHALEEQQRSQGFSGTTFGPGESFYVIPTSGGTASYANILSQQQQQQQNHKRGKSTASTDEFVDAKEHLPRSNRIGPAETLPPSSVREEELQIENTALKQILDKLSHRLQAFESHAQDASMAALTQSMASIRSQSHNTGTTTNVPPDVEERMRAMEAQLEREMKERERLGMENQKQKAIISKYRSHWEQLKTSARAREQAKRDRGEGSEAASG